MNVNPFAKVAAMSVLGGGAIGAGLAATKGNAADRADVVKGARTVALTGGVIALAGVGVMALTLRGGSGVRGGGEAVIEGAYALGVLMLGSAVTSGGAMIGLGGLSAMSGAALVDRSRGD